MAAAQGLYAPAQPATTLTAGEPLQIQQVAFTAQEQLPIPAGRTVTARYVLGLSKNLEQGKRD